MTKHITWVFFGKASRDRKERQPADALIGISFPGQICLGPIVVCDGEKYQRHGSD
jgi:hypothetical protein